MRRSPSKKSKREYIRSNKKTKRTIVATLEMACCRNGDDAYHPLPRAIVVSQIKKEFKRSLTIWRDRMENLMYQEYKQIAEEECSGMGTLRLCYFKIHVTHVSEE